MDKCEFFDICNFVQNDSDAELKKSYCDSAPLRCARFMIYQGVSADKVPDELMPDEKMKAYEILAEN